MLSVNLDFNIRDIIMSNEDKRRHSHAATCWICNGLFIPCKKSNKDGLRKVRDHDHITGLYRGAAHSKCNQMLKIKPHFQVIPVFSIISKAMMHIC